MHSGIKIFTGQVGQSLALETAKLLSIKLGEADVGRFGDGEVKVQLKMNVRDSDVFIINPTNPPFENILEMALLTEAAHDSSAGRITIIPTYLGYNRQDRKDRPRVPVSAHVIIDFLARRGADRVLLFDLHSEPTASFFKPLVVDHLYASIISIPYLKKILTNPFVVAATDKGGGPRAEAYATYLGQDDVVFFSKGRDLNGKIQDEKIKIIGDVENKDVLFVDDMIDTGGTMVEDSVAAKKAGARRIFVFGTHALLSGNAIKRLDESPIEEVVFTNTIYVSKRKLRTKRVKMTELSVAPLLAKAIRRIHEGESLSELIL